MTAGEVSIAAMVQERRPATAQQRGAAADQATAQMQTIEVEHIRQAARQQLPGRVLLDED